MSQHLSSRWITAILEESTAGIPTLPWERAAKRARRLKMKHDLADAI